MTVFEVWTWVQEDAAQVVVLILHQNILPVVLTHDSA